MNIDDALHQLTSSTPPGQRGGFVIFGGTSDLDYVQLALNAEGLLLNWPTFQAGGPERLDAHVAVLQQRGFTPTVHRSIQRLEEGEFTVLDDGLYARCGRNLIETGDLVRALLRTVFKRPGGVPASIVLELDA